MAPTFPAMSSEIHCLCYFTFREAMPEKFKKNSVVYYNYTINLKFLLHSICNSMKDQLISEGEVTYETQNLIHLRKIYCT